MRTAAAPKLYTRAPGEVALALRERLGWWPPEESGATGAADGKDPLADALIAVFDHYSTLLGARLNEAPERQLDAFVDLLRPGRFAAVPAQTVLVFNPVAQRPTASAGPKDRGAATAFVPDGTRVAGPTPPGATAPVIFETLAPLTLATDKPTRAFAMDGAGSRWADAAAVVGPAGQAAPLLDQAGPCARAVYFALPDALLAPAPSTLHLLVEMEAGAAWPEGTAITWFIHADKGPQAAPPESDGSAGLSQSGEVVWRDLALGPPTRLAGRTGHWLGCHVAEPHGAASARNRPLHSLKAFVRRDLPATPIAAGYFGSTPLDTSRDFFPLGDRPRFGDVFLARAPAFALPGAQICMDIRLTNPVDAEAATPIPRVGNEHSPQLQWEVWTTAGWAPLVRGRDGTLGLTRSGRVRWILPATAAPMDFQGVQSGFVRARLVGGDYAIDPKPGAGPAATAATAAASAMAALGLQAVHRPPAIASFTVDAVVQTPAVDLPEQVGERGLEVWPLGPEAADGLAVLPGDADAPAALYLGLGGPGPVAGDSGRQFSFALQSQFLEPAPGTARAAEPLSPRLQWQYRTAAGWRDAQVQAMPCPVPGWQACQVAVGDDWAAWTGSTVDDTLGWLRLNDCDAATGQAPALKRVLVNAVAASQRITIDGEVLGSSSGAPLQQFQLARTQVLGEPLLEVGESTPLTEAERQTLFDAVGLDAIRVEPAAGRLAARTWVRWHRVADFSHSDPLSRDYVLDANEGRVRFGDGRRGRIPPSGPNNLVIRRYRIGGGAAGNGPAGAVQQLRTTLPYVESVWQPEPALGGQDAESPASARGAATAWLRHRDRAVGPDDYEDLACRAAENIARARCLPARNLAADPLGRQNAPGHVSLAILPRDGQGQGLAPAPVPTPDLLARVRTFLRERCPGDVTLLLGAPLYVRIDIELEVAAEPGADAADLARGCEQRLASFLHPATGGADGSGWAFGRWPHASELRSALRGLPGLVEVRQLRQRLVEDRAGAKAAPHALLCAGHCAVRVVEAAADAVSRRPARHSYPEA